MIKMLNRLKKQTALKTGPNDGDKASSDFYNWITFILENSRIFLLALSVLLIVFMLGTKMVSWRTTNNKLDFILAANRLEQIQKLAADSQGEDEAAFRVKRLKMLKEIESLVEKHPELALKYDGFLAQAYIDYQEPKAFKNYADRLLNRTYDLLNPLYTDYAKTSLLIAESQFDLALKNAQALAQRLKEANLPPKSFLIPFNLLRIATLTKQLNLKEAEKAAWEQLITYGQQQDSSNASFALLNDFLKENQFSLTDYIHLQKQALTE